MRIVVKPLGFITCFLNTKRGSLGYLKCYCPTNKDYGSLLGMCKEFWVDIESILEETEKVFLQERTMLVVDLTVFAIAVSAVGNHWHNLTPETKSDGGLVQRHVSTLQRGRQEVVVLR